MITKDQIAAAERATELPEDLWEPLATLKSDTAYLFGRVALDGSVANLMAQSVLNRLSQIEEAAYRLNARATELQARRAAEAKAVEALREFFEAEKEVTDYENGDFDEGADGEPTDPIKIYERIEAARKAARAALGARDD